MPTIGSFYYSPALSNGDRDTGTEITIRPSPTFVDYGPRLRYEIKETQGRLIKQRAPQNPKQKTWVWEGYGPDVPLYETTFADLVRQQEHVRSSAGASPYVYLRETVSGELGNYNSGTGNIDPAWIRCRIISVERTIRKSGGYIRYPQSTLTFTIDDPNMVTE